MANNNEALLNGMIDLMKENGVLGMAVVIFQKSDCTPVKEEDQIHALNLRLRVALLYDDFLGDTSSEKSKKSLGDSLKKTYGDWLKKERIAFVFDSN